jgi:hypothetical protein
MPAELSGHNREETGRRTQYEVWVYQGDGQLVPTGMTEDPQVAAERYSAADQAGARPVMRQRTVTTILSPWHDAPLAIPGHLPMPSSPPTPGGHVPLPGFEDLD